MQSSEKNPSIKHLAHDLNNIFTRILNGIELLKRKSLPSEETTLILNNLEASTYLASEIIDDAISDTSKTNLTRRVNLNSIVLDVVRSFHFQSRKKINFELEMDDNLKLISGKFSDLYRVILNLITNSFEAISETGTISIKTINVDGTPDKIAVEISDTGIGISEEILPIIFEENFSTKTDHKISGIGLAFVKKVINELHGEIEVTSRLNRGTKFRLTFPAAILISAIDRKSNKSIIVAEDEGMLRELLIELLQSYKYNVVPATNGNDVLELMKKADYDLLIIDRKMPEMDGIDCIRELRKMNYPIPIVLASGSPTKDKSISTELKINKILNKPYNFEEMLSIIRELIG